MKILICCLTMLVMLSGCASQVRTEYDAATDFGPYKRFTWVAPEVREIDDPILDSELLTDRVRAAVTAVLTERGFAEVAAGAEPGADFFITYHTASKEKLRSSPFSVGIGYGHYYGRWGHSVLFDGPDIRSYEEGVLILDVINCSQNKLVWRGWDTSLVNQRNYSVTAVREAVEQILAEFPPGRVNR
ncbi:DUF4136 domain-containing protein [Exilibacterium tricleocarpae]|uniref:DUF4136 domain-containing protein n=1 Tax=Exilibacterium tricleocarpae TaxID=2591008 RepID=A0A545SYZ8_9GAMM|nr:DUF4136 domain-containing protein [Exilibacterium tricleocarpae]TQV70195.1 DUF4136 domain-containing protein [Exilibacterium tricleocarpae]